MEHLAKDQFGREVKKKQKKQREEKSIFAGGCKQKVQHPFKYKSGWIIAGCTSGAWDEKKN